MNAVPQQPAVLPAHTSLCAPMPTVHCEAQVQHCSTGRPFRISLQPGSASECISNSTCVAPRWPGGLGCASTSSTCRHSRYWYRGAYSALPYAGHQYGCNWPAVPSSRLQQYSLASPLATARQLRQGTCGPSGPSAVRPATAAAAPAYPC